MATENPETLEPHTLDSSLENSNPSGRTEIDTSAPFESVKEATNRFGGMGFWKPISHKSSSEFNPEHDDEVFDVVKLEKQTAQLECELIAKERETLDVLKELESTKNTVEELKLKLKNEASDINTALKDNSLTKDKTVDQNRNNAFNLCPSSAPGFILLELKQAKLNLMRTTNDLTDIRATVDLYNKKIEDERLSLEKTRKRLYSNTSKISSLEDELSQTRRKLDEVNGPHDSSDITKQLQKLSSETEEFKRVGEAAKSQVQKTLSEIEQTRARIKTVEARLIAAKKMKEAARASERVALLEIKALSKSNEHQQKPEDIITLTLNEYTSLISKARESERACEGRVEDAAVKVDEANVSRSEILKKVEEATEEVKTSKKTLEEALSRVEIANHDKLAVEEALRVWRSEHGRKRRSVQNSVKFKKESQSRLCDVNGLSLVNDEMKPVLKTTLSIGQILSRKLMMTEEYENRMGKRKVSLGQMLSKPSNGLYCGGKNSGKENKERQQLPVKRKKFGFARISLLVAKQNKKNKKNLNLGSILFD
ncbi:hypothetical protein CASFOL_040042 [Castilleja foliolosa]|uniref:WEB family protein n=1 Tax=Castilleja foliolosa TaxID=1961234 RepID=A0ABD3BED5_9LAMI